MARETLQAWAKRFVADLSVDGEPIAFDRVLRRHLANVDRLRSQGLSWLSIANAVTQAGGRRRDGRPFSPAQFRADFSRLARGQPVASAARVRPPPQDREPRALDRGHAPRRPAPVAMPPVQAPPAHHVASGDELSADELLRVRARLTRS